MGGAGVDVELNQIIYGLNPSNYKRPNEVQMFGNNIWKRNRVTRTFEEELFVLLME